MGAAGGAIDPAPGLRDRHHLVLGPIIEATTGVVAWAEPALDRGTKLLYAGRAFAGIEELVVALAGAGLDAEPAAAAGRLVVVEPDRFYSPGGYRSLLDQARRQGFAGVSSFGGPAAARGLLDDAGLARFEEFLDGACATPGVTAVCCYDPAADGGRELGRAVARHSSSWSERQLRAHSPRPGRLRLAGEVDGDNDRVFAAVCAAVVPRCGPSLHVDCEALTFMSAGGWRVLHAATTGFREGGGRVRLSGLTALTMRTLAMLGYERVFELDTAPGVNRRW